jgi:hypothetical protein
MLADRGLRFLGQQQAPQAAGRIGQRGGDGMVAVQPDSAFRRVGRVARRLGLLRPAGRPGAETGRFGVLWPRARPELLGARLVAVRAWLKAVLRARLLWLARA